MWGRKNALKLRQITQLSSCVPHSLLLFRFIVIMLLLFSVFPVFASELITNGGFELGLSGWIKSGNFYADPGFSWPHTGSRYAYLSQSGGSPGNNLFGTIYQAVSLPASASSITLSFWYNITSQDSATIPYDYLNVTIQNSSGGFLASVHIFSNVDKQTIGSYSQKAFDLTSYKGQTIRVHFLGTTNPSLPTTFRIDDVSITANIPSDTTSPTVNISIPCSSSCSTTSSSITIGGSATDSGGSGLDHVYVLNITNGSYGNDYGVSGNSSSFSVPGVSLTQGQNTIYAQAYDGAGNYGSIRICERK